MTEIFLIALLQFVLLCIANSFLGIMWLVWSRSRKVYYDIDDVCIIILLGMLGLFVVNCVYVIEKIEDFRTQLEDSLRNSRIIKFFRRDKL